MESGTWKHITLAMTAFGVLAVAAVSSSALTQALRGGGQLASVGTFGESSLAITANNDPGTLTVPYNTDAEIRWVAGGVQPGSCHVTGDGNDTGWRGEANPGFPERGLSTGPIKAEHVYALHCKNTSGVAVGPVSVTVRPAQAQPTPPPPPDEPPPSDPDPSTLKPLPKKYIYNVLDKNPNAPYPGNRIEFFISLNGSDAPGVTGLTPSDAFRTGQHCIDHIYSTYYVGSEHPQVFCRYMGTGTAQPAVYYENVQPTRNMAGAEGIAGTIPMFIGTMPLDGPWDNKVGRYHTGRDTAKDVVIDATRVKPFHCGTNFGSKPCDAFAGVNGTVFGIMGLTIRTASGYSALNASSPGTVVAIGDVILEGASSGLSATSGGQVIVIADISLQGPTIPVLLNVQSDSSIHWVQGTLHFQHTSVQTFISLAKLSLAELSGLRFDSNTGTVATSCVVSGNSVLNRAGAVLPGPGWCGTTTGGQLLP